MLTSIRAIAWGLGISGAAMVAAGCESSNHSANHMNHHKGVTTQQADAVTCGKCQVTWVREPVTTGGGKQHVVSYQTRKSMQCPDCRSAVDNFFRTGKLEHTCKTCGDALEVCEAH